jgi:hypothetical protein
MQKKAREVDGLAEGVQHMVLHQKNLNVFSVLRFFFRSLISLLSNLFSLFPDSLIHTHLTGIGVVGSLNWGEGEESTSRQGQAEAIHSFATLAVCRRHSFIATQSRSSSSAAMVHSTRVARALLSVAMLPLNLFQWATRVSANIVITQWNGYGSLHVFAARQHGKV